MRISDWSSDVCSSDLGSPLQRWRWPTGCGNFLGGWVAGWCSSSDWHATRADAPHVRGVMGDGKYWNTTGTPINRALFPQKISERAVSCTLLEGAAAVPGRSAAGPSRQGRGSGPEGGKVGRRTWRGKVGPQVVASGAV